MATIYYKRIKAGLMAVENVPTPWQAQVRDMLNVIE